MGSGQPCGALVCLQLFKEHFAEAHRASSHALRPAPAPMGGPVRVHEGVTYAFPKGDGAFMEATCGLSVCLFMPPASIGGCFAFDLQKLAPRELRFGVRSLGRGSPRHRLAAVRVSFGALDGTCVRYRLARALTADESLATDALVEGATPPAVRVDPSFLAPVLVLNPAPAGSRLGKPWELKVTVELTFDCGAAWRSTP